MYLLDGWVFIDGHIHPHTCETCRKVINNKQNKTHARTTLAQICPLAGPLVTAPESLFLKSPPSSALVLTPLALSAFGHLHLMM